MLRFDDFQNGRRSSFRIVKINFLQYDVRYFYFRIRVRNLEETDGELLLIHSVSVPLHCWVQITAA